MARWIGRPLASLLLLVLRAVRFARARFSGLLPRSAEHMFRVVVFGPVVMRSWAHGSMWLGLVLTDRVQVSSCRLALAGW